MAYRWGVTNYLLTGMNLQVPEDFSWNKNCRRFLSNVRPEPGGPSSAVHTPSTSASTPGAHLTHGESSDRCERTTTWFGREDFCRNFGGFLLGKQLLYVGESTFWTQFCSRNTWSMAILRGWPLVGPLSMLSDFQLRLLRNRKVTSNQLGLFLGFEIQTISWNQPQHITLGYFVVLGIDFQCFGCGFQNSIQSIACQLARPLGWGNLTWLAGKSMNIRYAWRHVSYWRLWFSNVFYTFLGCKFLNVRGSLNLQATCWSWTCWNSSVSKLQPFGSWWNKDPIAGLSDR